MNEEHCLKQSMHFWKAANLFALHLQEFCIQCLTCYYNNLWIWVKVQNSDNRIKCVEMGPGVKKLEWLRCAGWCFFSYISLDLLFIQDPLCQIRLVIKIKSTGKSAELESIWKGPCCPKFATLATSCYGSIVLFFASFKGQALKNQGMYKKDFGTKRTIQEWLSPETR